MSSGPDNSRLAFLEGALPRGLDARGAGSPLSPRKGSDGNGDSSWIGESPPKKRKRSKAGPGAPRVEANLERILDPRPGLQLTWLGHASFLAQLSGKNVLVDPVLVPKRLGWRRRHVPPGLEVGRLPPIHGVLVTHEHPDHLDEWTVRRLPKDACICVPEGLGKFFDQRGFQEVHELGWWAGHELPAKSGSVAVTLTPAHHGPPTSGLFARTPRLRGGFVVEDADHAFYHAGDTAFFDGFAEIGRRFPDLDVALLPVGSYRREARESRHLSPEEAGRAFLQTGARHLVPMHWGTFQLSDEPLREGPDRLRAWWTHADPGGHRRLTEMAVGETRLWGDPEEIS